MSDEPVEVPAEPDPDEEPLETTEDAGEVGDE